jgi:hypothetical protein
MLEFENVRDLELALNDSKEVLWRLLTYLFTSFLSTINNMPILFIYLYVYIYICILSLLKGFETVSTRRKLFSIDCYMLYQTQKIR